MRVFGGVGPARLRLAPDLANAGRGANDLGHERVVSVARVPLGGRGGSVNARRERATWAGNPPAQTRSECGAGSATVCDRDDETGRVSTAGALFAQGPGWRARFPPRG